MTYVSWGDIFERVEVHEQLGDSSTYCAVIDCLAAHIEISRRRRNERGEWVHLSNQHLIDYLPAKFRYEIQENRKPDEFGIYFAEVADVLEFIRLEGVCLQVDYPSGPKRGRNPAPRQLGQKRYKIRGSIHLSSKFGLTNIHNFVIAELNEHPLVAVVPVYSSFLTLKEGAYKGPKPNERILGYQAITVVSYRVEDGTDVYGIRNSWGAVWGKDGSCTIPLNLENFWSDFWSPRDVFADQFGVKRMRQSAALAETDPPLKLRRSFNFPDY